jgi:long-chain fatty acid transport protein
LTSARLISGERAGFVFITRTIYLHLKMTRQFLVCIVIVLHVSVTAIAGGFQVNTQSQRHLGMGHTGTALFFDASSMFFNPGASVFVDGKWVITGSGTFLMPRTVYAEPAPGVYQASMVQNVGTPFGVYAMYNKQKWAAGVAVYTPFGSRAEWPSDWKGNFLIREINLKTIFVQPTLSYQLHEKLGIGAGFIYATGGFALRKGVPVQDQNGEYGEGSLSGDASGFGFQAGILYKHNDALSFGASYRSAVSVEVNGGSAEFTVPGALQEFFPTTTFSTALRLPQVVNVGAAYTNDKWTFSSDVNIVGWSSYDSLRIDFADNTDKLEDISSARMYKNAWIARAGVEYRILDKLQLRAGCYFDKTPVQDGYITPETPDSDRIGITGGVTYKIGEHIRIDASCLYVEGMQRSDTNIETGFTGTYKSRTIAPGIGFTLKF